MSTSWVKYTLFFLYFIGVKIVEIALKMKDVHPFKDLKYYIIAHAFREFMSSSKKPKNIGI